MKRKSFHLRKPLLLITATYLIVAVAITACRKENHSPSEQGVTWQYIETYDLPKLNHILNAELEEFLTGSTMHFSDFQGQLSVPAYPVKLYRVTYPTIVPELGLITVASGLVAVPDNGLDSMPVISYQHGTVMLKTACPSIPDSSLETRLMIAQFASRGYIVIGPDFFGLGVSDLPHADFIRLSTEQACVDMLKASDKVLKEMKIKKGPLFLHGWSQGGWATMTFLRCLETQNIPVTAASTACAAADFFATMNSWINNPQPEDSPVLPAIVSNCIFAYENYHRLGGLSSSAIKPAFLQASRDLYAWNLDYISFLTKTTTHTGDLLQPAFKATGNTGSSPFWQALDRSESYRWRCRTPLRMYYGEADTFIPLFISTMPAEYQQQLGCNTLAVSGGAKADHAAGYIYSIIHAKEWFDSMMKK